MFFLPLKVFYSSFEKMVFYERNRGFLVDHDVFVFLISFASGVKHGDVFSCFFRFGNSMNRC